MRRYVLFLLFTLSLLFLFHSPARGEEKWVRVVQSTAGSDYFIDANSLIYRQGSIAVAWYKLVEAEKAKDSSGIGNLRVFGKDFSNCAYTKMLVEINCSTGKLRTLVISAHDKSDNLIHRDETLNGSWTGIPKKSCFDTIRDVVCKR